MDQKDKTSTWQSWHSLSWKQWLTLLSDTHVLASSAFRCFRWKRLKRLRSSSRSSQRPAEPLWHFSPNTEEVVVLEGGEDLLGIWFSVWTLESQWSPERNCSLQNTEVDLIVAAPDWKSLIRMQRINWTERVEFERWSVFDQTERRETEELLTRCCASGRLNSPNMRWK